MAIDLYLGTRMVALRAAGDGLFHRAIADAPHEKSKAQVTAVVQAAWADALERVPASRWRRTRVRVWWSGGLCRPFLIELPRGAERGEARRQLLAELAPERTGLDLPCEVWAEPQRAASACLAVAVPAEVHRYTMEAIASRGLVVLSAAPWWSAVLNRQMREAPRSVVGVRDCDSLTVFNSDGRRFDLATGYAPVLDEPAAELLWQRALSRIDGSGPMATRLRFSAADAGAGWVAAAAVAA